MQKFLVCVLVSLCWRTLALTYDEQQAIESYFFDVLNYNAKNVDETPGDTAAAWVRLCFHDAVTYLPSDQSGGAHACIWDTCAPTEACERNLQTNAGLGPVADALEKLYQGSGHYQYLSRPDYWHLSCKSAIEWASGSAVRVRYDWGRTDSSGFASWPDRHPVASGGFGSVQDHLVTRLGFTWEEAISLLGAHALGHAVPQDLGYDGRWVSNPTNHFNNNYFKVMLNNEWYQQVNPALGESGVTVQYVSPAVPNSILLFTDAGVPWQLDGKCNITSSGPYPGCPVNQPYHDYVAHFASDNTYFLNVFAEAFWKLSSLTGDKLYNSETTSTSSSRVKPSAPPTGGHSSGGPGPASGGPGPVSGGPGPVSVGPGPVSVGPGPVSVGPGPVSGGRPPTGGRPYTGGSSSGGRPASYSGGSYGGSSKGGSW